MPIIWNDTLNTGIGVIDSQHRRIVAYINALVDAVHEVKSEAAVMARVGRRGRTSWRRAVVMGNATSKTLHEACGCSA